MKVGGLLWAAALAASPGGGAGAQREGERTSTQKMLVSAREMESVLGTRRVAAMRPGGSPEESGTAWFERRSLEEYEAREASGVEGGWMVTFEERACAKLFGARGLARREDGTLFGEFFGTVDELEALEGRCQVKKRAPWAPEFKLEHWNLARDDLTEVSVDFVGDGGFLREVVQKYAPMAALDVRDSKASIHWPEVDDIGRRKLRELADFIATFENATRVGGGPSNRILNYEARWIVQSDDAGTEATPLYSRDGLLGQEITVGCADSGLDYRSCFYYDPDAAVNFETTGAGGTPTFTSETHRKLRQYVGHADTGEGETSGHGTHVTGTIAGHAEGQSIDNIQGADFYVNDGMAPLAKLAFYDIGRPAEQFLRVPAAIDQTIFADAYAVGAKIHSNSWGANVNAYLSNDQSVDQFSWDNQDFVVLIAAGNSGPDPSTLGSPATSKNGVAVGATENVQSTFDGVDDDSGPANIDLASFSSRGPAFDGRLKPDVVAPGDSVISANSLATPTDDHCAAARLSGTSMATPVVAGTLALVQQYFNEGFYPTGYRTAASTQDGGSSGGAAPGRDNNQVGCVRETCFGETCDFWNGLLGFTCDVLEDFYGCDCASTCCGRSGSAQDSSEVEEIAGDAMTPMGAMLKALLVASGRYLPGAQANRQSASFPNQDQGFGLIVVDNALNPTETSLFVDGDFDDMSTIATASEAKEYDFEMAADGELRVVLAWHDPPSVVGTNNALINDLDLVVTRQSDGATFLPNGLTRRDSVNNVERVVVSGATRGQKFTARVSASAVNLGPQPFSVVATGPFLRTAALYPNHAPEVTTASRGRADGTWLVLEGAGFTVGTGGNAVANASVWTSLDVTCDATGAAISTAQVVAATSTVFDVSLGADSIGCDAVSVKIVDTHRWYVEAQGVKLADDGAAAAQSCYRVSDLEACASVTGLCQTTAPASDAGGFVSCEPSDAEQARLADAGVDVTVGVSTGSKKKKNKNGPDTNLILAAVLIPLLVALVCGFCLYLTCVKTAEKKRPNSSLYRASTRRVPRITSDAIVSAPLPKAPPPRVSARLPDNWEMLYDEDSGNIYYFDKEHHISTWDRPLV